MERLGVPLTPIDDIVDRAVDRSEDIRLGPTRPPWMSLVFG